MASRTALAEEPLTEEQAIEEALSANVHLPAAHTQVAIENAHLREVRGQRGPTLGIEGDLHGGIPSTYASGDARLQLVGRSPLYDAGLAAEVRSAEVGPQTAEVESQIARSDLRLDVRSTFAEVLALEEELRLRDDALQRLRDYVDLVALRQRSGDPVAADLLRAEAHRQQAEVERSQAARALASSRMAFNGLLGRPPDSPFELAKPADSQTARVSEVEAWKRSPEVALAESTVLQTRADVDVEQSARRPVLDVEANVGAEPILGPSAEASENTGHGLGAEALVELAWPIWNHGVTRARIDAAQLTSTQAEQEGAATNHDVELAWRQARGDVDQLAAEVEQWRQLQPKVLDALLYTESLYRGGGGDGLEVMDAFDAWIDAGVQMNDATLEYREANARLDRWEGR